jgi:DNA-binding MarR family transcriptional regulator
LFWWGSGGKIQEGVKFMSAKKEKSPLKQQQAQQSNNNLSIADKEAFINNLFENLEGFIEIREIKNGQANTKYFKNTAELMEYDPPADKNIYIATMTRNKKRGRIEDTEETRVLWADYDDVESFIEIEYILDTKGLPQPSIIVDSGHGYHTYHVLDKPAGAEIQPVLKELAARTGADSHATDLARIMRLPDTMNVKDDPVKCKLITINKNKFNLNEIADLLGVEPKKPTQNSHSKPEQAAEVLGIDYKGIMSEVKPFCIKSMLEGVEEGERNWILGRLTKHFKNQLSYTKNRTEKIIKVWNTKNDPPQPEGELLVSFNKYWHTDYNLEACRIKDKEGESIPQLQQIINKYCDKDKCMLSEKIEFKEGQPVIEYNNWLLNHIKEINVYELIIYGVLAINKHGLTANRAAEIIGITEKTFRKHANKTKFVNVKKGIKQRGIKDLYYLSKKGTYTLGRTKISYAAIRLLNAELKQKLIKPIDIKVYMLLRYIEYKSKSGEVYPATTTLAEKLNSYRPRISKSVNRLEKRDIIKINRQKRRSNTYKFEIK